MFDFRESGNARVGVVLSSGAERLAYTKRRWFETIRMPSRAEFERKIMIASLLNFWYTLRHSDLLHYFSKNGHGVIEGKRFRGWREHPNQVNAKAATWTARIVGGPRGDGFFATLCYSDGTEKGPQEFMDKVELASRMLDLYADPNCRCRLGFHWKCSLHDSWKG